MLKRRVVQYYLDLYKLVGVLIGKNDKITKITKIN